MFRTRINSCCSLSQVLGKLLSVVTAWPYDEAKADGSHPSTPEAGEGVRATLRMGYKLVEGDTDPDTNIGAACTGRGRTSAYQVPAASARSLPPRPCCGMQRGLPWALSREPWWTRILRTPVLPETPFASRSVQRARLTPQVKPSSRYRCGKRN